MGVVDTYVSGYFDTIQTAVEWEAKLEIAEVEANARRVEAIMGSLGEFWESSGAIIAAGLTAMSDSGGRFAGDIKKYLDAEMALRERGMVVQERMADAEIAFMEARIQRMQSGDPLITVSGDGLAPHLEAIMFDVLGAVQMRAQEDYQAFLLGATS